MLEKHSRDFSSTNVQAATALLGHLVCRSVRKLERSGIGGWQQVNDAPAH